MARDETHLESQKLFRLPVIHGCLAMRSALGPVVQVRPYEKSAQFRKVKEATSLDLARGNLSASAQQEPKSTAEVITLAVHSDPQQLAQIDLDLNRLPRFALRCVIAPSPARSPPVRIAALPTTSALAPAADWMD